MRRIKKAVTTVMIAALIGSMEGTTIPATLHQVKADTTVKTDISQTDNDLTQYKKIT